MTEQGFLETLNSLFGGTVTTLIGAFTGRLMYHSGEVKLGRRRFFGKELLWEIPVAIGMAIIGTMTERIEPMNKKITNMTMISVSTSVVTTSRIELAMYSDAS